MTQPIIMFDMDGTLLDLAFDDLIWNLQLPQRHAQTHQCTLEQSYEILGKFYLEHNHTLAWYSSTYWTAKVGVDVLQLQYDHQDQIKVRPGCVSLLKQLQAQGYRCWLVTNADVSSLKLKMNNIDLTDYFEVMISSEQIGHAKEELEFWKILQQRHPFAADRAMLVDDNLRVLAAAENFGIKQLVTILQPSSQGSVRDATQLDYDAIQDLTELLDFLAPTQAKEVNVKTA